jgi:hypothetical protein
MQKDRKFCISPLKTLSQHLLFTTTNNQPIPLLGGNTQQTVTHSTAYQVDLHRCATAVLLLFGLIMLLQSSPL